jgi:hypothetical protein
MSILAVLFVAAVSGSPPGNHCPLVDRLNAVIADQTGYVPPSCPQIGFSQLPAADALRSQAGAFFPDSGRIELAPDLDLTSAYGQSFLLHELVHAAQYANGAPAKARCIAQLESEAYLVQSDFLRAAGLPREALMMRILAQQLGACSN